MPLKDLFTKAPSPLPPSEEPWPRSEVASSSLRDKFRQSPLHSATARPTLDEFLRTNYLMIPDFLLQVNNAKIAARTGKSVHDVQSTAAGHSGVKLAVDQRLAISSANIAKSNDEDVKMVETREMKEKDPKPASEVRGAKSEAKPFAMSSQKRSYEQIQVPPPLRPKPRVKKVMKGGTLVTIPAPQPRKRAREEPTEDGGKSMLSGVDLISSEGGEDGAAVSEMSMEDPDINKSCDRQQLGNEDDSTIACQDESDLQSEVFSKESKESWAGILTEECEQTQASLTLCNTDTSKKSKNATAENTNSSLSEPDSSTCTSAVTKADESIAFLSKDLETNKDAGSYNEDVQRESINVSKSEYSGKTPSEKESELIDKEPKLSDNLGEAPYVGTPPIADPKEVEISKVPTEETVKGPGSQVTVCVVPEVEAIDSSKMEKLPDLSNDLAMKSSIVKQSSGDDNKSKSGEGPNRDIESKSYSQDSHATDKGDSHIKATDHSNHEANYRRDRRESHGNNTHDLKAADLESCNADTVNDVDENSNSENCSSNDDGDDGSDVHKEECEKEEEEMAMEEEKVTEEEGDDDDDDDDDHDNNDDNDDEDDEDDDDVSNKDNPADDSTEEYAELVMDDSTSEEEEEYDFYPVNENNSDEDDDEESDYEVEDMNLDSDTEASTGGITFYQDTTIGKRVKRSRNKQREKRKAKIQRKKASKKRAKAAKQAAQAKNKSHDSTARKKSLNDKHKPDPDLKKRGAKVELKKQGSTSEQKPAETVSKPNPTDKKPSQSNPQQKRKSEEGSLLSMVSSCAVDPTVAASEKLFVKKRRGGQHAKKKKKEKRKAEALERIRRGEPPPRPRRTFVELPKPICSFYREGKCRKGSDCSFRHDKSALIKKKEVCKFYLVSADTCYAGDDCIFMHSSFPCKFFHTSRCWEGEHCRFSHDVLTEETKRLLQACLKPTIEDSVESPQDKNLTISNQQTADSNTCSDDTSQTATSSSPYNFRASTRKRALSTDGTDGGSLIGGKISRRESQGKEEEDSTKGNEGQAGSFLPGLYRDLST